MQFINTFNLVLFSILTSLNIFAGIKLFKNDKKVFAKSTFTMNVLNLIIFVLICIFKIQVPQFVLSLVIIAVFLACFCGYYLDLYKRMVMFDRLLHTLGSFAYSLFIFYLIDHFVNTGGSALFESLFIFTLGNSLGVFFELIEALHDLKSNIKAQKGLADTNVDMIFNLIGSILSGLTFYEFLV